MTHKIQEDAERGVVVIDEVAIPGHLDENRRCQCGSAQVYHDEFDAYFCPDCNLWLEDRCSDKTCEFCSKRPEYPL